jgi:predicted transcriptional regulator
MAEAFRNFLRHALNTYDLSAIGWMFNTQCRRTTNTIFLISTSGEYWEK